MLYLNKKILNSCVLSLSALMLFAGCSAKNPPVEKISNAQSAISRASDNNAEVYSPLELKIAKEKLDRAQELSKEKKYEDAAMLAEEAKIDARLAEEKSRTKESKKIANEILDSINALKAEIKRLRN